MEAVAIWKEGMSFEGRTDGYSIPMDATPPLGHHYGPSPKDVLLTSLAGLAGMDVVGLLKKEHQFIDHLCVEAKVSSSALRHPVTFDAIELFFHIDGSIDLDIAIRTVELSQTRYCGISAMLTVPIEWNLILNGEKVADGRATFNHIESDALQSTYEG